MKALVLAMLVGMVAFSVSLASVPKTRETSATDLVLPKGTYTSIVFTATGVPDAVAAIGVIKVGNDQFAVNIAPGATVAIPFGSGWKLDKDAEVRLAHGAGPVVAVPSAWAVTPDGPIALRPR